MRRVFADTCFRIAILDENDRLHEAAHEASKLLKNAVIFTSELVLVELANHFASKGAMFRMAVVRVIERIQNSPNSRVVYQTKSLFTGAVELYRSRNDKGWSLADCSSMEIMKDYGITECLSHDSHFEQAGFTALLRK
ncbi:MAG: type II toxin-antitoxin system VapC family toxin [Nitrospinae bacterium]|nr:type II toxin-antitoxin system VapC family toxin [Nitrospinota bacterium]